MEEANVEANHNVVITLPLPDLRNDDNVPVKFGNTTGDNNDGAAINNNNNNNNPAVESSDFRLYCGRRQLGGGGTRGGEVCGGPSLQNINNNRSGRQRQQPAVLQCPSCIRLQTNPTTRIEVLKRLFPSIAINRKCESYLVGSLRACGGNLKETIKYIQNESSNRLKCVDYNIALSAIPISNSPQLSESVRDQVDTLVASLGYVTFEVAEYALRKNRYRADEAANDLLQHLPTIEMELFGEIDEREKQNVVVRESNAKRKRAIIEAASTAAKLIVDNDNSNNNNLSFLCNGLNFCPLIDDSTSLPKFVTTSCSGHRMILAGAGEDNNNDESSSSNNAPSEQQNPICCVVCSSIVPSLTGGNYYCELCHVCEGCIQQQITTGSDESKSESAQSEMSKGVVYHCPGLRNGGHLHQYPLVLNYYSNNNTSITDTCSVNGDGCLLTQQRQHQSNNNINPSTPVCCWSSTSPQEKFNVCSICIRHPAPLGYDRLLGKVVRKRSRAAANDSTTLASKMNSNGDGNALNFFACVALLEEENEGDGDDEDGMIISDERLLPPPTRRRLCRRDDGSRPTFNDVNAEREAAALWEGEVSSLSLTAAATSTADASSPPALLGSGFVGNENELVVLERQGAAAGANNNAGNRSNGSQSSNTGSGLAPFEGQMSADASEALERYRSSTRHQLSDDNNDDGHGGSNATNTTLNVASSATDETHVEDLLRRAQAIAVQGPATTANEPKVKRIYDAIASNRIDIASMLLMAEAYSPTKQLDNTTAGAVASVAEGDNGRINSDNNNNNNHNDNNEEEESQSQIFSTTTPTTTCWCGDDIDPGDAVGCLGGHAMHSSCAADLLLGGGSCPTCRQPLFFSNVATSEAMAGVEFVETEVHRLRQEEEERVKCEVDEMKKNGLDVTFEVGDVVRISSDFKLCETEQLKDPISGGWHDDMITACGLNGRVTDIVFNGDSQNKDTNNKDDNNNSPTTAPPPNIPGVNAPAVATGGQQQQQHQQQMTANMYAVAAAAAQAVAQQAQQHQQIQVQAQTQHPVAPAPFATTMTTTMMGPTISSVADVTLNNAALADPSVAAATTTKNTEVTAAAGAPGAAGKDVDDPIPSNESQQQEQPVAVKVRSLGQHYYKKVRLIDDYTCSTCNTVGPSQKTGNYKCIKCNQCIECCRSSNNKTRMTSCPQTSHEWHWNPSLLTPVRRSGKMDIIDEDYEDENDGVTVAAGDAERRIMRLRGELVAVKRAREDIKSEMDVQLSKTTLRTVGSKSQLSEESISAVQDMADASGCELLDWQRACHLLLLSEQWGNVSDEAKTNRSSVLDTVRSGNLDSTARIVRRFNASRTTEAAKWADALSQTASYVVEPNAKVDLRAFPSSSSPRTGYSLNPLSKFSSRKDVLDTNGGLWLQVEASQSGDTTDGIQLDYLNARPGVRFSRTRDNNTGRILRVLPNHDLEVRWDGQQITSLCHSTEISGMTVTRMPPSNQGWLCVRPGGNKSPAIVTHESSNLRCFGCGDKMVPTKFGNAKYTTVKDKRVNKGDRLFVAATLEPVTVVDSSTDGQIFCSFLPTEDSIDGQMGELGAVCDKAVGSSQYNEVGHGKRQKMQVDTQHYSVEDYSVWYRPEDLVFPGTCLENDTQEISYKGMTRTRRELVLMFEGDQVAAQNAWEEAKKQGNHQNADNFASCAKGHLLHPRCLQSALLAGRCCPAAGCREPLFVPSVSRSRHDDDDTCCANNSQGTNNRAESEALEVAAELSGQAATVAARISEDTGATAEQIASAGAREPKMCPVCCSGPVVNDNCADMRAHHGQCSFVAMRGRRSQNQCTPNGTYHVSSSEIAARMGLVSGTRTVADVLPKCETHKCPVMFNGCLDCGHLFTDIRWDKMPKWDPNAKTLLEFDQKTRNAARLLADQVRNEAASLQFERDSLAEALRDGAGIEGNTCSGGWNGEGPSTIIEPPPAPIPLPASTMTARTEVRELLLDDFDDEDGEEEVFDEDGEEEVFDGEDVDEDH